MRLAPFLVALVLGLALLTAGADAIVTATTREWFARDMVSRAEAAIRGANRPLHAALASHRRDDLADLLADMAHDTRILAAYACGKSGAVLARTATLPPGLACDRFDLADGTQGLIETLPEGSVHLSFVPLPTEPGVAGIVLVHDTSAINRREAATRSFLVQAFALLALAASAMTLVASRVSWRGWNEEIMRFLKGGETKAEFQPVMRDVREMMERLVTEREAEGNGSGAWTATRLKNVLTHHLQGERVVIVANREPYIHSRTPSGQIEVQHPASGLVTALEPVMRACSGVWVAHGSGSADRETTDRRGHVLVPPGEDLYTIRRVWLNRDEEQGYYYGFANEGLWPLCHIAHTRPVFRSADWKHFQAVNQKFADAACDEVESDDPIVLVQDYHLALAPRLIRERLPRATIITFWHCPWPAAARFAICPYGEELLHGMLGSSIVGFHTQADCNNFMDSVDRTLEARIDRQQFAVVQRPRTTLVRPYPISVEWPNRWVESAPPIADCRASVRAELGLPADTLLGVGVDRIDYIKGIEERMLSVEKLLEREPGLRGRFTFVQLAAPSRSAIEAYRAYEERIDAVTARINARFPHDRAPPIILRRAHHEPPDVFRYLRGADLCYVSSLHDGMNLVAKEFIAARTDERGVLILSEFAGAMHELSEALIVNPYDLDRAADAIATALRMPAEEQRDRMRAMRAVVAEFNVYRWAGRMLVDAARLRRQERVSGRIARRAGGRAA